MAVTEQDQTQPTTREPTEIAVPDEVTVPADAVDATVGVESLEWAYQIGYAVATDLTIDRDWTDMSNGSRESLRRMDRDRITGEGGLADDDWYAEQLVPALEADIEAGRETVTFYVARQQLLSAFWCGVDQKQCGCDPASRVVSE